MVDETKEPICQVFRSQSRRNPSRFWPDDHAELKARNEDCAAQCRGKGGHSKEGVIFSGDFLELSFRAEGLVVHCHTSGRSKMLVALRPKRTEVKRRFGYLRAAAARSSGAFGACFSMYLCPPSPIFSEHPTRVGGRGDATGGKLA